MRIRPKTILAVVLLMSGCGGGNGDPGAEFSGEDILRPTGAQHAACLEPQGRVEVDIETGSSVFRLGLPDGDIHGDYFAGTLPGSRDRFIFICDAGGGANFYRSEAGSVTPITQYDGMDVFEDVNFFGLTPYRVGQLMFYAHENVIYQFDLVTGSTETIAQVEEGLFLWAPIYATEDAAWLSFTLSNRNPEDPRYYLARVEVSTGQFVMRESPFAGTDKLIANHAQIHPFNPDIVMFAHEGRSVQDRIWLWRVSSGEVWPIHIQPPFVEWGHERWTADGEGIYVVQYGNADRGIDTAIHLLDQDGEITWSYATSGFGFVHAALSPDGSTFMVDTTRQEDGGRRWMMRLDVATKSLERVYPVETTVSPGRPHVSWAEDGTAVFFNDWAEGSVQLLRWLPE